MNGPSAAILELEGVSRLYGRAGVTALRDVSLAVAQGECLAIMGPSGCGKSTLLNILSGLDRPTSGRVLFEGREPRTATEWARLRAGRIGFVFQAAHLLPALTAAENVQVPLFGRVRSARERTRRAAELLDRVGLAGRVRHLPGELSGGECQRVAIARSLANRPAVLLADEPTGNLDSRSSAEVLSLLMDIRRESGMTVVVVTHEATVAARADRTQHMLDGRVVDGHTPGG